MADSERPKNVSLGPKLHEIDDIIKQSTVIEMGTPTRYHLKPRTESRDPSKPYKKITYGERDTNKPHKTVLMVGETGTGKTTLTNTMINYMLGVKREDKVWFEITDDQSDDRSSVYSQTSSITVYGFYLQESPIHLTIIDTPGYGNTCGVKKDKQIAEGLLSLSKSAEEIKVDAVCLVIRATHTRLSDRQIFTFDAVQSLFGRDIAENIVLLFTHSTGRAPKNALMAVEEAEIKCAVNEQNQPLYFLFDNCQGETYCSEYQMNQEQSWDLSSREMTEFFKFLEKIKQKSLKMTRGVLQQSQRMKENISNLQARVEITKVKKNELKQTQDLEEHVKKNMNFEYEVEVPYKVKVNIDPSVAYKATCCSVCEENCHYPGCWSISGPSLCSVMKKNHCRVCTNKCHYSKHVKEAKIYVTKTKKKKRTDEALKKKYDDKISHVMSLVQKLEGELRELEREKKKLVIEAFHCVEKLQMIALNTDSLLILENIDFLIEKLKEINEPEKAETLENIKKRAGDKTLRYTKLLKYYF